MSQMVFEVEYELRTVGSGLEDLFTLNYSNNNKKFRELVLIRWQTEQKIVRCMIDPDHLDHNP